MIKDYNSFNFTSVVFTIPLNKQDAFKVVIIESRYLFFSNFVPFEYYRNIQNYLT